MEYRLVIDRTESYPHYPLLPEVVGRLLRAKSWRCLGDACGPRQHTPSFPDLDSPSSNLYAIDSASDDCGSRRLPQLHAAVNEIRVSQANSPNWQYESQAFNVSRFTSLR